MAPYGDIKCNNIVYDTGSGDATRTVVSIPQTASPVFTGNITINAQGDFRFADSDSSNFVGFQAPATVSTNVVWTLPAADGSANQLLKTDGSGVLSWGSVDLTPYAPLASPALTGTATAVNLTLSGDLVVNGSTTTINSTNTTITDNLLELNSGASSNANDSGIIIERGSTGDNAIFAWDESVDKFIVGTTTATAGSTGNISVTAGTLVTGTVEDSKGNIRSIPVNAQSSSATYVAATSDAGKSINATGTTQTVELSGSAGFSAGDAVTIINGDSTTLNITATNSLSLRNTADAATGNRALAQYGMATVYFTSSTVAYISGAGLS